MNLHNEHVLTHLHNIIPGLAGVSSSLGAGTVIIDNYYSDGAVLCM